MPKILLSLALVALSTVTQNKAFAGIVMDVSKHSIEISRNFRGTTVTAFGLCDKDEDIVIVFKGGSSNVKVKKMHKYKHIWSVESVINFSEVPNMYTIYSNRNINSILPAKDISDLRLTINELPIKDKTEHSADMLYLFDSFNTLVKTYQEHGLLGEHFDSVEKVDNSSLFRIHMSVPERIKAGSYNVVAYSVKNNKISGFVSIPLEVKKVGINGMLYELAFNYSKTYAALSIVVAVSLGWLVNYLIQAVIDKASNKKVDN